MKKPMDKWTQPDCEKIIKELKPKTDYFNWEMTREEFYNMLVYRRHFEKAEATIILCALLICGAKFRRR